MANVKINLLNSILQKPVWQYETPDGWLSVMLDTGAHIPVWSGSEETIIRALSAKMT